MRNICTGCHIRERLLRRTHERLEAAFRELDRAYDAVRAVVIDTAGPTLVRKTGQTSDNPPPPTRRKRGEQLQLFDEAA